MRIRIEVSLKFMVVTRNEVQPTRFNLTRLLEYPYRHREEQDVRITAELLPVGGTWLRQFEHIAALAQFVKPNSFTYVFGRSRIGENSTAVDISGSSGQPIQAKTDAEDVGRELVAATLLKFEYVAGHQNQIFQP